MVECCFTSTETVGLLGTGAQDGHLDFHTAAPEVGYAMQSTSTVISGRYSGGSSVVANQNASQKQLDVDRRKKTSPQGYV